MDSAMERGWALVGQVLAWLAALDGLARGWMPGRDWWRAFAELRQAEGVARRLVIALALEGPAPAAPTAPPDPKPDRPAMKRAGARAPYAPGFALFDPLGALLPGAGRATGPERAGEVPHATHGLASRLAALSAVLEDPSGAAARMARFLAGEAVGRASPLRPGAPPGWHAGLHMSQAGDRYMEAHRAALTALNAPRAPPTLSAI